MKLIDRIANSILALTGGTRVGDAIGELFNRYEAAQPSTPKRSYIPAFNRDARYDANSWSRWEMTRKIRYFERNVWLVQAIRDEHVKWTVGPNGLTVLPASSDEEWNKGMEESYQEWCENPCFDSTIPMPQVHKQIAGTANLENDLFVLKTFIKNSGKPSRPAIQLIESHRCSAPGTVYSLQESSDTVDGVQLGKGQDGKVTGPIGYWMIDDLLSTQWAFRSVAECIHIFSPERIGMYRGITPYHSVMNTLHDLDDLESMEMERAKNNSEISNIITSPSGELNRDALRARRFGAVGTSTAQPDSKDEDIDRRIQMYRKILGARTIALKTGEKLEQQGNENPSAATQWYWKYKLGQVSKTAGVPLILIFPELIEGMQGTVVRGIYDNAHETFRGHFFTYARTAINLYRYYANWARYNDPRCFDAPADWNKCHVIPPRAVNVDIGYTSAATLAELASGVTNYDDIAGRQGTTAEVLIRKKAKNVKMINDVAAEFGIEPADIAAPMADVLQKLALATQAESLAENPMQEKDEPVPAEQ
jgi:hypothetical protein